MMNSKYFQSKNWWNFEECIEAITPDFTPIKFHNNDFKFFVNSVAPIFVVNNELKPHINELMNLLYNRYSQHYLNASEVLDTKTAKTFLNPLFSILQMTYNKYATILDIYESNKNKLMNGVKVISDGLARFNDTPQNEEVDDEFEADNHVTTITKSKNITEDERNTIMTRIKEIEDSYNSVLAQWSNEFEKAFIEESNL